MVRDNAPPVLLQRRPAGVMIGTPMYGGLCHDAYLLGMLDLNTVCAQHEVPLSVVTLRNESLVQRGRNRVVAHFLASDASHLVFIDADIGFTGRDVMRLVAHDQPIVGATYPKKDRTKVDFAFVPMPHGVEVTDNGLVEVAALPGGFMCVSREAIVAMVDRHGDRKYRLAPSERKGEAWEECLYGLFECDICPQTGAYWSEDYLFCRRWTDMGRPLWLDPFIMLEHHGTAQFDGDPTSVFSVANPDSNARMAAD